MQLKPLSSTARSPALPTQLPPAGAAQRPAVPAAPVLQPQSGRPAPAPREGLGVWAPELNTKVANAQQALSFLDTLSSQLQDVKAQLSLKLAGAYVREDALERQQRNLAQLWSERAPCSGHSLDPQLNYSGDTPSRQRFRIRGLDQHSLEANGRETLVFSLNGASRKTMSLQIEADLPLAALAARFNRALAPAGIQVRPNAQGKLDYFTVPDSQWSLLRDNLAIKGDGKRFPTGEFARVRLEPEPAIIEPGAWQLDEPSGLRQALPQIVRATQQISVARAEVQRTLADVDRSLSQSQTASESAAVQMFAQSFEEQTRTANYPILSALSPSLVGLPRYRIESLLPMP